MKLKILCVTSILFAGTILFGQYTETFDVAGRGILAGPCGATPTSCASFNFTGVTWNIEGDLAGIDTEGFSTSGGNLVASDTDGNACWISPIINTSAAGNASFTVNFTIPAGSSWDNNGPPGVDYADISYAQNGGAFTVISNLNGCPGSGHTISWIGCTPVSGPLNFAPTVSGLTGNTLQIKVCVETNASTDIGNLEQVSVTGGVLPVAFNYVSGKWTADKKVLLEWQTASEVNNHYFDVQRSFDGKNFESIGLVYGHGNSTSEIDYQFTDDQSRPGIHHYYKLKQTDFDGNFKYSAVVQVKTDSNTGILQLKDNPVGQFLRFTVERGIFDGPLSADLISTDGKVIRTIPIVDNENNFEVDMSDLKNGLYLLRSNFPTVQYYKVFKTGY